MNSSETDAEIYVFVKDYIRNLIEDHFVTAGSDEMSNAEWITIPSPRMLLKGRRKSVIKLPIQVPEKIDPGSYHSIIFVRTASKKDSKGSSFILQYGFQVVSTVKGGTKNIEVVNVSVDNEKNLLLLDLKNTGTEVLTFLIRPENAGIEQGRRVRIYPNQIEQKALDISQLVDGKYRIRFLFDDEKEWVAVRYVEFRKGPEPKEIPITELKGERLASYRTGRPFRLFLNLHYGNFSKGISLNGNVRVGNFSLNLGGSHTGYEWNNDFQYFNNARASLNYSTKHFHAGFGNYMSFTDSSDLHSMANIGITFKRTNANLSYILKQKIISGYVYQKLTKKLGLYFSFSHSEWRKNWDISINIPIL